MTEQDTHSNPDEEDALFRLLRQIDLTPEASQRDIASAIGVSLGRLNAQLRTATADGFIKISERQSSDKRQRFSYVLTQRGAESKAQLTDRFLDRKRAEFNALYAELTGSSRQDMPPSNRTLTMTNNLAPIPELFVSYDSAQKMKMEAAELLSLIHI